MPKAPQNLLIKCKAPVVVDSNDVNDIIYKLIDNNKKSAQCYYKNEAWQEWYSTSNEAVDYMNGVKK